MRIMTRLATVVAIMLLATGCVTGPVENTKILRAVGDEEGAKMAEIANRNIEARYAGAKGRAWAEWKKGYDRLTSQKFPDGASSSQVSRWAAELAREIVRITETRDAKLAGLENKRVTELGQVKQLQINQVDVQDGIVRGWAAQGEVSSQQYRTWLGTTAAGVSWFIEQQKLEDLRKEAEREAKRPSSEEE